MLFTNRIIIVKNEKFTVENNFRPVWRNLRFSLVHFFVWYLDFFIPKPALVGTPELVVSSSPSCSVVFLTKLTNNLEFEYYWDNTNTNIFMKTLTYMLIPYKFIRKILEICKIMMHTNAIAYIIIISII